MSKKPGVLDVNKESVFALIDEGKTNKEIGDKFGVTGAAVGMFKKKYNVKPYDRTCALIGCGKSFSTTDPRKIFCSTKCSRAQTMRVHYGYNVEEVKCSNPECTNTVYRDPSKRSKYCSKYCSSRASHIRYRELLNKLSCSVCSVSFVVDLHHIIPVAMGGTDDLTNIVCLCPNHHTAIHRGVAELTPDMVYHIGDEEIKIKDVTHYGVDDALYKRIKQARGNLH